MEAASGTCSRSRDGPSPGNGPAVRERLCWSQPPYASALPNHNKDRRLRRSVAKAPVQALWAIVRSNA